MRTPHWDIWSLAVWSVAWLALCFVLLALSHHYLDKATRHVPAKVLKRARTGVTALIVVAAIVVVLDILKVVQIPPIVITLYTFGIPVIIAGLISPLVPGIMLLVFKRYEVGDYIYIGSINAPLAHGEVVNISLQSTFLQNSYGEQNLANAVIQSQPVTKTTPPMPHAVTGLDGVPEERPDTLNQAADEGATKNG